MNCEVFKAIRELVCDRLKGLDARLTYHNLFHTLDVTAQAERIAGEEQLDSHSTFLVKVAALYHDSGFLEQYKNHEETSCLFFMQDADKFGFSEEEKKTIVDLIMATKVPQQPQNLMQAVICDADLDYLGRDDFFTIGNELKKEFLEFGIVASEEEWEKLQIKFLSSHHYHTRSSIEKREPVKQRHVAQLV